MVLKYREDGKKEVATATDYNFLDSYKIIKGLQTKRVANSADKDVKILFAGFPVSAAVLAGVEEQRRMWATALMAMEADRAMRSEEDELFWLLCAAVAN